MWVSCHTLPCKAGRQHQPSCLFSLKPSSHTLLRYNVSIYTPLREPGRKLPPSLLVPVGAPGDTITSVPQQGSCLLNKGGHNGTAGPSLAVGKRPALTSLTSIQETQVKGPSPAGLRTGRGPRPPWEADVMLHKGTHVKDERAPRHPVHRLVEQSCGETGRGQLPHVEKTKLTCSWCCEPRRWSICPPYHRLSSGLLLREGSAWTWCCPRLLRMMARAPSLARRGPGCGSQSLDEFQKPGSKARSQHTSLLIWWVLGDGNLFGDTQASLGHLYFSYIAMSIVHRNSTDT